MRALLFIVLALFLLSPLAACDPGFRIHPVNYDAQVDGVSLHAKDVYGLIGESLLMPDISISSGSKPVTIESVELITKIGSYPGKINDDSKTIPPFTNQMPLTLSWDFSNTTTTPKAMGLSSRIVFHLKVGDAEQTAEISYWRDTAL